MSTISPLPPAFLSTRPARRWRILIDHGAWDNLGDTAILESVVNRLAKLRPDAELHVIDRPALRTSIWDLPSVRRAPDPRIAVLYPKVKALRLPYLWRFAEGIDALSCRLGHLLLGRLISARRLAARGGNLDAYCDGYDALHVAGGGNLTDSFSGELWRRCSLLHVFAARGKLVMLSGQQFGPFRHRATCASLARALRAVQFIGLREAGASAAFCRRSGLDERRYTVMGDDSFGLPEAPAEEVGRLLAKHRLAAGRFLAANIRVASYADGHARHLKRLGEVLRLLSSRFDLPVLIVPVSRNPHDSDLASGRRLAEATGRSLVSLLDEPALTPALVKGVLGQSFGAVGVSYHFCTFALSRGVPAVCLFDGAYYSQKGDGLCQFWGDERLAQPLADDEPEAMAERIGGTLRDEALRGKLRARAEEALRTWRTIFDAQALALPT